MKFCYWRGLIIMDFLGFQEFLEDGLRECERFSELFS